VPNQGQFLRQIATVLLTCGLSACLLPGLAAAQDESTADNQWGPGYRITPNGVRIDGIRATNPTNRVIWDDDMYSESKQICWTYVNAQAKLGRLDLRGAIMTYAESNQQTWQRQIDGYNFYRDLMRDSGLTTVPDTFIAGARQRLVRPASGRIEDTQYRLSDGARFIIQQADASTTDNPLIVFVGGQATTVATAILERPDIANRMIVFSLSSIPVGWNGKDEWASHIAARRAPHISFGRQTHAMGGDKAAWEGTPNNPLINYLRNGFLALHDGGPVAWYFNQHLVTGAQRRIMVGDGNRKSISSDGIYVGSQPMEVKDVNTNPYGHLYMGHTGPKNSVHNPDNGLNHTKLYRAMVAVLKDPRVWDPDYSAKSVPK